jgi:hypothetical protein
MKCIWCTPVLKNGLIEMYVPWISNICHHYIYGVRFCRVYFITLWATTLLAHGICTLNAIDDLLPLQRDCWASQALLVPCQYLAESCLHH